MKISVQAEVRYWENATVNGVEDASGDLFPCRVDNCWCPEIDIDSGVILNWEKGKTANIHFKVCDGCSYHITDDDGQVIAAVENEYVPRLLCPEENGYGDYIIMVVDHEGKIRNWNKTKAKDLLCQNK